MKLPFMNTRIYGSESTFSIDFYENYENPNYIDNLLGGIAESKRNLELKSIDLRQTPFYFTQCSKCGFYIPVSYTHLTLPTTPYV